jgi:hypothetical protein
MNKDWPRWIMASVAKYFSTTCGTIPLPLLVDGIDERISEDVHYDHAELRINGPLITELSKNYFKILVDVNVLITELMTSNSAYDLQTWCGVIAKAMDGPINIYKYGNEDGDNSSWVMCLVPCRDNVPPNRVMNFGQLGRSDRIRESMIDGHFVVYVSYIG